jgi:multiple sugar transport system ATP-binding protein
MIRIDRVSKTWPGGVRAVDDVSLEVGPEELLVLVGPSGCGKTTLLRMIAGLESVGAGSISLGGRVVNDVSPADRDLAMVFQNYALYPHMTVRENLSFGLRMRKTPADEIAKRVAEAAETLGLGELLGRLPKELSGGQRQRVALGRAIVRRPKAFLFDEPLSNLDARLRVQMRAEIKRLHRLLRIPAVYVTHDQEEAMTLGDRIAVMKDGRVRQLGKPLDVYGGPADRFVAGFVGTPPMNFLEGVVRDGWFEAAGLRVKAPAPAGLAPSGPAVLGLRPEHLAERPPADANGSAAALRVRVGAVEPLGDRVDAALTLSGLPLVGRLDARAGLREGEERELWVDLRRAHLFEAGPDGRRIA